MIINEDVKLIHGDCIEVMKSIPDGSVDLILCDLPYGTTRNKWDSVIDLPSLWREYNRISRGPVVLTCAQPFTSALITSNLNKFKYCWVWKKSKPTGHLNAKKQPLRNTEDIAVFYENQPTYNPQGNSQAKLGEQIIMAPNTTYLLRITSLDTAVQNINAYVSWFEDDTYLA